MRVSLNIFHSCPVFLSWLGLIIIVIGISVLLNKLVITHRNDYNFCGKDICLNTLYIFQNFVFVEFFFFFYSAACTEKWTRLLKYEHFNNLLEIYAKLTRSWLFVSFSMPYLFNIFTFPISLVLMLLSDFHCYYSNAC